MTLAAPNWKQWVSDFIHGRTHVAYGLMAVVVSASIGVAISTDMLDRTLFLIADMGAMGSLVDTVAHLYYH